MPLVRRHRLLPLEMTNFDEASIIHSLLETDKNFLPEERLAALDITNYLLNDILVKVDRASMMNSLEVRVPLLDHEMVEFSAEVPFDLKYKRGEQKYILRRYIERLFPNPDISNMINRQKHGFRFPLEGVIRGPLSAYIRESVLKDDFLAFFGFDRKAMEFEVVRFFDWKKGGKTMWMIFCLFLWWNKNFTT